MADPDFGFRDSAEPGIGASAVVYEHGWQSWSPTGDRLASLDAWGLETTRRLLQPSSIEPFALEAAAVS